MSDTIESLSADIASLTRRLDALKDREATQAKWPQHRDSYWFPTGTGDVERCNWIDSLYDKGRQSQGIFRTEAEAIRERDRRALIVELRQRAGGFKPDWTNVHQDKWLLYFDHDGKHWDWSRAAICEYPGVTYFPAEDKTLIAEYGERLNLLLGA